MGDFYHHFILTKTRQVRALTGWSMSNDTISYQYDDEGRASGWGVRAGNDPAIILMSIQGSLAPTQSVDLKVESDSGVSDTDNVTSINTPIVTVAGFNPGEDITVTATKTGSLDVTATRTGNGDVNIGTLAEGVWIIKATNGVDTSLGLRVVIDNTAPAETLTNNIFTNALGITDSHINTTEVTADEAIIVAPVGQDAGGAYAFVYKLITSATACTSSIVYETAIPTAGFTGDDGTYKVCVEVKDVAGNIQYVATPTFTRDTVVPIISAVSSIGITTDTTPDLTFTTSEAGTLVENTACGISASTVTSGENTIALTALAPNTYSSCTIQMTDTAGNTSATESIPEFTITNASITIDALATTPAQSRTATATVTGTNPSDLNWVLFDPALDTPEVCGSGLTFPAGQTYVSGEAVTITSSDADNDKKACFRATVSSATVYQESDSIAGVDTTNPVAKLTFETLKSGGSATAYDTSTTRFLTTGERLMINDASTDTSGSGIDNSSRTLSETAIGTTEQHTADNANTVTISGTAGTWPYVLTNLNGVLKYTYTVSDEAGNTHTITNTLSNLFFDTTDPATPVIDLTTDTGSSNSDNITNNNTPTISITNDAQRVKGTDGVAIDNDNGKSTEVIEWHLTSAGGSTFTKQSQTTNTFTPATALSDGVYKIKAAFVDQAGNEAESAVITFTIDTTAPTKPTTPDLTTDTGSSSTDDITNNNTPTITTTAVANATYEWTVDGAVNNSYTTNSITTAALSNGDHTFSVKVTDRAGNQSTASDILTITVDTTAPTAPTALDLAAADDTGASQTDNRTNKTSGLSIAVAAAGENGGTVQLYRAGTTAVGSATTIAAGTVSIDISLTQGTHSITAKTTDVAGNVSVASSALTIIVDTTAPTKPTTPDLTTDTGSSSTDDITNNNTPTITTTAVANATYEWTVDGAVNNSYTTNSITTAALSNGDHTFSVKVTDRAGNQSTASDILTITVDTTAPTAPTTLDLAAADDTGASQTDNRTNKTSGLSIAVAAAGENGGTVQLYRAGTTAVGSATTVAAGTVSIDISLTQGTHSITAKTTDVAGNVSVASSALTIIVDTTAPTKPTTPDLTTDTGSSSTDDITNNNTPTITTTAVANATYEWTVDGAVNNSYTTNSITTAALSNGDHTFSVKVTDRAGNQSTASDILTITVDTTAPTAPTTLDLAAADDTGASQTDNRTNKTSGLSIAVAVAGENGGTVQLYRAGTTAVGSATTIAAGTVSIDISLTQGTHSITAKTTDVAGNVSVASSALTIIVDTTAPTKPTTPDLTTDTGSSSTDDITNNNTPTITTTAVANATYEWTVDGAVNNSYTTNSITTAALSNGDHTFSVKVTDRAGNQSTASDILTITVDTTAPTLSSPSSIGPTADTTPDLTFTTTEGGSLTLGGSCATTTTSVTIGTKTITLSALTPATYSNCTITVTDTAGNASNVLAIPSFSIVSGTITISMATTSAQSRSATATTSATATNRSWVLFDPGTGTPTCGGTTSNLDFSSATAYTSGTAVTVTSSESDNGKKVCFRATIGGVTFYQASDAIAGVDTTAPTAPTALDLAAADDTGASQTDNRTNKTSGLSIAVAVAGENGGTVQLYRAGTTAVGSATTIAAGTVSIDISLTQGTHSITAKTTDVAGNVSVASSALTIIVDTTAPTKPTTPDLTTDTGSSSTDDITNNNTPTITTTAVANATYEWTVDGAVNNSYTTNSITTAALSNGDHTFSVKVTDRAGNQSTASDILTITVDTTAPTAPTALDLAAADDTGASQTDNRTNKTSGLSIAVAAAGENGGTVQLYRAGTTAVGSATTIAAGTVSIDISLTQGTHSITAKTTDVAGNVSVASSALTIIVDTTAPTKPTTPDLTTDTGSSSTDDITNNNTPTITTTAVANATYEWTVDGAVNNSYTTNSITTAALSNGDHTFSVKVTDRAGNQSTASDILTITVDTTAPTAPTTLDLAAADDTGASQTDNRTNKTSGLSIAVAAAGENGGTVQLYRAGTTAVGSATTIAAGTVSIDISLTQGTHSITAKTTDVAGNVSAASSALTIIVDTTAPTLSSPSSIGPTADTTPDLTFTTTEGGSLTLGGSCATTTTSVTTGTKTITLDALTPATYSNCTITVTDTAGNASSPLAIPSFSIASGMITVTMATTPATSREATATAMVSSTATDLNWVLFDPGATTPPTCADTTSNLDFTGASSYVSGEAVTITSSEADNGKKACFRAIVAGVTFYKASDAITGVDTTAPTLNTAVTEGTGRSNSITVTIEVVHNSHTDAQNPETVKIVFSEDCSDFTPLMSFENQAPDNQVSTYTTEVRATNGRYATCTVAVEDEAGNTSNTITLTNVRVRGRGGGGSGVRNIYEDTEETFEVIDNVPEPSTEGDGDTEIAQVLSIIEIVQTFTRDLTVGSVGEDVRDLQQLLNSLGFTVAETGPGSPGEETAYFGSATQQALIRYQEANDIEPAQGYFGQTTRAYVNQEQEKNITAEEVAQQQEHFEPYEQGPQIPFQPFTLSSFAFSENETIENVAASIETEDQFVWTRDLTIGSTGEEVRALQEFLNQKGFIVSESGYGSPGQETEYFGEKTRQALIRYQQANGIEPAQGYFGPITRTHIRTYTNQAQQPVR